MKIKPLKRYLIRLLSLCLGLWVFDLSGISNAQEAAAPAPVSIDVDAALSQGPMPETFKIGLWITQEPRYIFDKFMQENVPGVMQFDINPLAHSQDLTHYKKLLIEWTKPGTYLRHKLDMFKKEGNPVSVGIVGSTWFMPRWLSTYNYRPLTDPVCEEQPLVYSVEDKISYCDAYTIPFTDLYGYIIGGNTLPRDWSQWREAIQFAARYYYEDKFIDPELGKVDGLGLKNISFWLGHEPDWSFFGSEKDFFELYDHTVSAIKDIYPQIKVGGTGSSWFDRPKQCVYPENLKEFCAAHASPDGDPMLKNLLEYRGPTGKVSLDFLNYHQWGASRFNNYFESLMSKSGQWLWDNGYDAEEVTHYPADWNYTGLPIKMDTHHDKVMDTEFRSAYVISTLYDMEKAGIQWHSADFGIIDKEGADATSRQRNGSIFVGSWPIFTRINDSQIIKPVYNAFRALSLLNGKEDGKIPERIQVSFEDSGFLTAIASLSRPEQKPSHKQKRTLRILLANFIPPTEKMPAYLLNALGVSMKAKGYTDQELLVMKNLLTETASKNPRDPAETIKNYWAKIFRLTDFRIQKPAVPLRTDEEIRRDLLGSLPAVELKWHEAQYFRDHPLPVHLKLTNLSLRGPARWRVSSVDQGHANACRYNKATESKPSDTECGVDGEIDQRVRQARREARRAAFSIVLVHLKQKDYTTQEMQALQAQVIGPCLEAGDNLRSCFKSRIDFLLRQKTVRSELKIQKLKKDIQSAVILYKNAFADLYYYGTYKTKAVPGGQVSIPVYIDKINTAAQVSLEGSRREKTIEISADGSHEETLTLPPYSVMLIEIRE